MRTFNQLPAPVVDKFIRFNAIRYDLENFLHFLRSTPPEELDLEFYQVVVDKCLTEIYKNYEDKNPKNPKTDLENS